MLGFSFLSVYALAFVGIRLAKILRRYIRSIKKEQNKLSDERVKETV